MAPVRFNPNNPSYEIDEVRRLAADPERCVVSKGASIGCANLGLLNEDIFETLQNLEASSFYKAMEWEKRPGEMFDVYYATCGEHSIYLKFAIVTESDASRTLIVSSFKENEQI